MTLETLELRPAQREILAYTGGRMAIAAVPGAGKTFILTQLAAKLIEEGPVKPSEILILTYMRSAATNFKRRISDVLTQRNLSAYGLTASTIHAFCLSIIKRHFERYADFEAGESGLVILSEAEQELLLLHHLEAYLKDPVARHQWQERYAKSGQEGRNEDPLRKTIATALKAISAAKTFHLDPEGIARVLDDTQPEIPYLYAAYVRELRERHAVDYDDQIQQAIRLLETHAELLGWYQRRFRFVMEDEAQDSTPAQNRLIALLTAPEHGGPGNLVRVGDSNQAITTSFTFNDPRFFRDYCMACEQQGMRVTMAESSRSGAPVVELANTLVAIAQQHPDPMVRGAFDPISIELASAGKRNPDPDSCSVRWRTFGTKDEERLGILTEIRTYLRAHPEAKVSVLCYSSTMCENYVESARLLEIPLYEPERGKSVASRVIDVLKRALSFLALPSKRQAESFVELLEALALARRDVILDAVALRQHLLTPGILDSLIYPSDGLAPTRPAALTEADYALCVLLARRMRILLGARHLPPIELLPTIAHELLPEKSAQTLASKAASVARMLQGRLPYQPVVEGDDWLDLDDPLVQVQAALDELAITSEKRSFGPSAREIVPPKPGELEILTLHKSKGAEYEAVWIPNLGYYFGDKTWFPWRLDEIAIWDRDAFVAEQLISHAHETQVPPLPDLELDAKRVAIAEKLRLLYVGITRAERHLTLSAYGFKPERMAPWHILELAKGLSA